MSWPETKGDKVFAGFLILCVVWAILTGWFESSARSHCEDVLAKLWENIYSEFGAGLQKKLSRSFSSSANRPRSSASVLGNPSSRSISNLVYQK
jgi:hypothetical protein